MKTTPSLMFASMLLLAACSDDDAATDSGKIAVADWATEMAQADYADTIQDKFEIVVDTADPAAFDGVIAIARQQAADAAALGD
jgi:hypothetical protein